MLLRILTRFYPLSLVLLALLSGPALAQKPLQLCVFDPAGKDGDLYAQAQNYLSAVSRWAGPTEVRSYVDEKIATEDFKAGQCDGVLVSSLRARPFNSFVGSIDSVGGLPTPEHLKTLLGALANPRLQPYMEQGPYEVAGVIPLGPLYVMVRDRNINSIEKGAGRKVAVMEWDNSQSLLVQSLAAQPILSDVSNFAAKFNNGQVDIIVAPALLYRKLELDRGLGQSGAVFRFPLAQLTATLLIHRDRFPAGFGQHFREFVPTQLDDSFAQIAHAESGIPEKYWLSLSPADEERYTRLMQDARTRLMDAGYYDPRMLGLLKRVRCKLDPAQAECAYATLQ